MWTPNNKTPFGIFTTAIYNVRSTLDARRYKVRSTLDARCVKCARRSVCKVRSEYKVRSTLHVQSTLEIQRTLYECHYEIKKWACIQDCEIQYREVLIGI